MAEEKVELSEQTPLKQEEENKEAEKSTEAGEEAATEKKEAEKKRWFFNKKAKKEEKPAEEKAEKEKNAEGGEVPPAEKKKCWWQKKPCCKKDGEQPTFGIDYVHRDDQNLQTAIDLNFADIFGEPDALHSWEGVWRRSQAVFNAVRGFFYKLFSLLLFIPATVVFGVLFALFSALNVYVVTPLGKLLWIPFGWVAAVWKALNANVLGPVFGALGQGLSSIRVHRYGLNNDATATIAA
ncbi:unnamed protein product [Bursaphelenchus xylophilus]|nr:unnamed protein product [Bursaphelenchus xylophilus]CAG9113599.1 unnamed protein product [Bursaphelenchus xylophilus]